MKGAWAAIPGASRSVLIAALITWTGVGSGRFLSGRFVLLLVVIAGVAGIRLAPLRFWMMLLAIAMVSGLASQFREAQILDAEVPDGQIAMDVEVVSGPFAYGEATRYVIRPRSIETTRWAGPPLAAVFRNKEPAEVGDIARVEGVIHPHSLHVRGRPLSATYEIDHFDVIRVSANPFVRLGNLVRARVLSETGDGSAGHSMVAGFLIGDTGGVDEADIEAMRQAGLSHFVAVSGSNVALFLAGWWIVTLPLSLNSRARAWLGLFALGIFVVATRWEPSVVRASGMATLVLVGRLVTWPVDRWMALGLTVLVVLLVSPELSGALGFQLSVAATAGVMAAPRPSRRPVWLWSVLYVTLGAQLAVAPLLLRLGTVPLLAPLANLVAAPLVSLSTTIAMAGVLLGSEHLVGIAAWCAEGVLNVAWAARGGPQLNWLGLLVVLVGALGMRTVRLRPLFVSVIAVGIVVGRLQDGPPMAPTVVFADVGQGDSSILMGPGGEVILIDGGPDPAGAIAELSGRSLKRIDLVIASHRHADHVTGLVPVLKRFPVGLVWHPGHVDPDGPYRELLVEAATLGIPIEVPRVGTVRHVGPFRIEVLAPQRRYKNPNDQSIVVSVGVDDRSVLFTGDVERVAQADLGPVRADVLKVPHQGAITSDPGWLTAIGSQVAVIPVGPNTYGHPSPEIVAALTDAGTRVLRTDLNGDIVLTFEATRMAWRVERCVEPACPPFD